MNFQGTQDHLPREDLCHWKVLSRLLLPFRHKKWFYEIQLKPDGGMCVDGKSTAILT
jgi:hypothetical protein